MLAHTLKYDPERMLIQRIPENRKLPYPTSVYCFIYGHAEDGYRENPKIGNYHTLACPCVTPYTLVGWVVSYFRVFSVVSYFWVFPVYEMAGDNYPTTRTLYYRDRVVQLCHPARPYIKKSFEGILMYELAGDYINKYYNYVDPTY